MAVGLTSLRCAKTDTGGKEGIIVNADFAEVLICFDTSEIRKNVRIWSAMERVLQLQS